jgi:phosphoglycerate dehydrogenase-like enzyme
MSGKKLNVDDNAPADSMLSCVEEPHRRRGEARRRAGADGDRPHRRPVLSRAGEQLRLIANFGAGVDNIDVDRPRSAASSSPTRRAC